MLPGYEALDPTFLSAQYLLSVPINPLMAEIDLGGQWLTWWYVLLFFISWLLVMRSNLLWRVRSYGFAAVALFIYVLSYDLVICEYPAKHFEYNLAYQMTASRNFIEVFLLVICAWELRLSDWTPRIIPWFTGIALVFTWWDAQAFLVAPSFNAAFVALSFYWCPPWLIALGVFSILTHHGATAVTVVVAQVLAYALTHKRWRWLLVILLPIAIVAIQLNSHSVNWDSQVRIAKWTEYAHLWWHQNWAHKVLGMGPGTAMWQGYIQDQWRGELWPAWHCEPLQILFEEGLVGLVLALAICFRAVQRTWKRPSLLASVFGGMAFCLTYHPLRMAPTAILMALIFSEALNYRKS